jgi:hypothetical protein
MCSTYSILQCIGGKQISIDVTLHFCPHRQQDFSKQAISTRVFFGKGIKRTHGLRQNRLKWQETKADI